MKRSLPVHPILIALFPVASLFSYNVGEVEPLETLRPALVVLALVLLLWLLLRLATRDSQKAALLTSALVLFFFSIERILPKGLQVADVTIRHRYLTLLGLAALAAIAYWLMRARGSMEKVTASANAAALILFLLPVATATYALTHAHGRAQPSPGLASAAEAPSERPDIYYIILDSYNRADVLKRVYGYDNSAFLRALAERGFYVADESRPNYGQTLLSLSSSLNMRYLDDCARQMGAESKDKTPLGQMIRHSEVASALKRLGYRIVSFSTGVSQTELTAADVYLAPPHAVTEFEEALISTTPLWVVETLFPEGPGALWGYSAHRRRILYTLHNLPKIPRTDSPLFVFAHINSPHHPFVFDPNGKPTRPNTPFSIDLPPRPKSAYIAGYDRQLTFLNREVLKVVDGILAGSPRPPVIILQGDHGGASVDFDAAGSGTRDVTERFAILNAYLVPARARRHLYPSISPVNTFRLVLDSCFGTKLGLLPDRTYFSAYDRPYDFTELPRPGKR